MPIKALIFDLGGVLIDIDWPQYAADNHCLVPIPHLWPFAYEKLNPTLAHFLLQMHPHYKIATICNGGSREAMNRKFRLHEFVDLLVYDDEEGISKPDPRIYQRTLLRLGVQPPEALFVDDKLTNVQAAQRLGIHSIHFQHTEQTLAEIQKILAQQEQLYRF